VTAAELKFKEDYAILRAQMVRGEITLAQLREWVKLRGAQTAQTATEERLQLAQKRAGREDRDTEEAFKKMEEEGKDE